MQVDPLAIAIVSALIGAGASIAATVVTLIWTSRSERARHDREWESQRVSDRRGVYGRFLQTATLWREACADLPDDDYSKDAWNRYWRRRIPALEAAIELSLIAPPEVVEAASEAMDELLDISWDYDVNGEDFIKAALWNKIRFIDDELEKVTAAGRTEFGAGAPAPNPRRWTKQRPPDKQ